MKKKYISPEIKLMKLPTEYVMAALSKVDVGKYSGGENDTGISGDIDYWQPDDENSQPQTAKRNNSFGFWDDEE